MDQSDLMTVRDTLDAVACGNVQVEDVVTALEICEASITTNGTPVPTVAYDAQYNEAAEDALKGSDDAGTLDNFEDSEDDNETS